MCVPLLREMDGDLSDAVRESQAAEKRRRQQEEEAEMLFVEDRVSLSTDIDTISHIHFLLICVILCSCGFPIPVITALPTSLL